LSIVVVSAAVDKAYEGEAQWAYVVKHRMRRFSVKRQLLILVLMLPVHAVASELVVWLIPLVRDDSVAHTVSQQELDRFNQEFGVGNSITVLNTTVPVLRDQLFIRNPESAEPNWSTIISQRHTLSALKRFAQTQGVVLKLRFIKWGRMFASLNEALLGHGIVEKFQMPDVVQIGSTWKAYFEQYERTHQIEQKSIERFSVPYTYDLRLLYYWRQTPNTTSARPIYINGSTWDHLLDQFYRYQLQDPGETRAFLVMPIGLTLNLIHDYAPLVWGGGGNLFDDNMFHFNTETALEVPRLIAKRASVPAANPYEPVRVIGFPEVGHVEAIESFIEGKYRAIIEPVGFLKHWEKMFQRMYPKSSGQIAFEDHLGIAALPVTFQGGSELMVTKNSRERLLASELVRFLVSDTAHLNHLAQNGYLPANLPDFGVSELLHTLDMSDQTRQQILNTIDQAMLNRKSYPQLADWPNQVETLENLEAMQFLWRRIAQGNDDGLADIRIKNAAELAQYTINKKIHPMTRLIDSSVAMWPVLAVFIVLLFLIVMAFLYKASLRQRRQILALLLFRGKYHSTLSAYGAAVIDFIEVPPEELEEKLMSYGSHIAQKYNHHIANMVKNVCLDLSGRSVSLDLLEITEMAVDGARKEFYAAMAKQTKLSQVQMHSDLHQWEVPYLGHILVLVLQEWIFNTYKSTTEDNEARLNFYVDTVRGKVHLCIKSNILIARDHRARLESMPSPIKDLENWARAGKASGQGLSLIRDLLWYSFKSRVSIVSNGQTELRIPIPVKPRSVA